MSGRLVPTPAGDARVREFGAGSGVVVVLGHGAGAGFTSPDLRWARDALVDAGHIVAEVEQPWLVAGRRVAPAPATLDRAWDAVLDDLGRRHRGAGLVLGGRSAGARVACRSWRRAIGVFALAFPLHPPSGSSRAGELAEVDVPVVVVQGDRDRFGTAAQVRAAAPRARVVDVPGADHGFALRRSDDDGRAAALVGAAVVALVADATASG